MAAKYTAASNTTAGDRLLNVGHSALQLSTGDMVMLVHDPSAAAPNKVSLQLVPGTAHTTPSTIATLSTDVISGAANFVLGGYPQALAMCRDASDNLYVIGDDNLHDTDQIGVQAFKKGTGLTWTPATYITTGSSATEGAVLASFAATWCNTGGGTNSKGHLMVVFEDTGTKNYYAILDAGALLAGSSNFIKNCKSNPTFLGSGSSATNGSNLAISNDGFGTTSGIAVAPNSATGLTVGAWGITASGALTAGGGLVDTETTSAMSATTKTRAVRYAANSWAVFYRSSGASTQLTCRIYSSSAMLGNVDTGVAGNFPAMGATLSWDVSAGAAADLKVWVYGWSSATATTMLRLPITMTSLGVPSVGAAVTDDTSVGTAGTTIRAVREPVDILHTDWQSYQSTSTYGLLGDFSAVSSNPNPPTLLTPANNAIPAISTGGTFTWSFSSPVSGDAQTAFMFRDQPSGGAYRWWDGAAWQTTTQTITSTTTALTFPTGQWTAGSVHTWWVQTVGAAPTNNLSGYSAGFNLQVANSPPTAPTLTAAYDPTANRTVLTLQSSDSTGATGSIEYSNDAGATWGFVRNCTALGIYPSLVVAYDVDAPPGVTVQYRARSWTVAPQSFSAYATASALTAITTFWLRDVLGSLGSVQLKVVRGSFATHYPEFLTEHQGLGNPSAIVVADVVGLEDGGATFLTMSVADEAALMALLLSQTTLLLQSPDNRSWYIRVTSPRPTDIPYILLSGSYRQHIVTWRGQARP